MRRSHACWRTVRKNTPNTVCRIPENFELNMLAHCSCYFGVSRALERDVLHKFPLTAEYEFERTSNHGIRPRGMPCWQDYV